MAMAVGFMNGGSSSSWIQRGFLKNEKAKKMKVSCVASCNGLTDQYRTLRIQPGASEGEVKKAFRQLALQYHPDVCKGKNCGVQFNQINEAYDYHPDVCKGKNYGVQFNQINEAYDIVMSYLRGEEKNTVDEYESYDYNDSEEPMCDPDWDMWEEWMGWEGAGIRDYSSHINPYI
ncbi:hypothetical protein NE237_026790 [Protea cynaroides]|uniref:J domain-containing protein n=1 Tax=Protea cynaroides TaxID=273540 RepID=A0A9Q0GNX4_9MAGN|nr:hypothetical protein NE237_026790 [Protea cynaroides]